MINSLQSFRGLFAIMIFLHHYLGNDIFGAGGPCGVAFFLILSGFVMSAGYEGKAESNDFKFSKYYLKRVIRVYPLHFLCLLLYLGIHIFSFYNLNIFDLIPNILLLQSWIPFEKYYFSGNAVSWCLSDLMFFYALFPLIIHLLGHYRKAFYSVMGLIIICYFSFVHLIPQYFQHAIIYINPLFRLIDFTLGMMLWNVLIWLRTRKITETQKNLSYSVKSLLECIPIVIVTFAIIAYNHVEYWFGITSMWWIPCLLLIYTFAIFNNSGGH